MSSNNTIAAQQLHKPQQVSPVNKMFNGRSVFVTGSSGFIGRVLIEKLLRTYRGINKIYILMRTKKDVPPGERLQKHLLDLPIFDRIKSMEDGQQLLNKLVVVPGDIAEPSLGISEQDLQRLLSDETLSIVFHSAASTRFDNPLRVAIKCNLLATKALLDLCANLKNLVSVCHVSTIYVNSDIRDSSWIEEKLYPMQHRPEDVLKLAEILDDKTMQKIESDLVAGQTNTYTYTKALAEHLIATRAAGLPVAIVRPSIVMAAWREPIPGWVDNVQGPNGLILAVGKGLLRTVHASRSSKCNGIPVDIVVNMLIAAAYYAAKAASNELMDPRTASIASTATVAASRENHTENDLHHKRKTIVAHRDRPVNNTTAKLPEIFHCASNEFNPITLAELEDKFYPEVRKYPSKLIMRYPRMSFKKNKYHDLACRLYAHYLPALVIDLILMLTGRRPQLVAIYRKLHRAIEALFPFALIDYNFRSKNIELLESCLVGQDRQELYLDIRQINWQQFADRYAYGVRRFVLKEPDSSLESARRSLKIFYYAEMSLRLLMLALVVYCCWLVILR